jgi:hypothetical protein
MLNIAEVSLVMWDLTVRIYSLIGHTHRPDFTCFPGSQERLPSLKAGCFPPVGAMYEIEVQVIYRK